MSLSVTQPIADWLGKLGLSEYGGRTRLVVHERMIPSDQRADGEFSPRIGSIEERAALNASKLRSAARELY
jgi:hypothetical protein